MTTVAPKQCHICGSFYLASQEEEHANLHIDPTKLAPKTNPNNLKKMELSKVIIDDEGTDSTDIALRSLLPDEIPHPEAQKKNRQAPQIQDEPRNDSNMPFNAMNRNNPEQYRQVRDRLDLTSKLANTDLSKDQLNKLEIEKQVQLKPIKTMVAKKQIHKFQNSHYAAKETKDLGGCEKKVPNQKVGSSLKNQRGSGDDGVFGKGNGVRIGSSNEEAEPGYVVQADNTYLTNNSRKSTVVVPINRKTMNPNEFTNVDTINDQNGGNYRRGVAAYRGDEGSEDGKNQKYQGMSQSPVKQQKIKSSVPHSHGLHPHQCPDCHGFYCPTCHATIPPEYRPFWDNNETPEMVQYYKKRVIAARERERKLRNECETCHNPKPQ